MVPVMFMRRVYRRRWRGMTLFGVLMGLSLGAIAVIGSLTLYNSSRETQARNAAQQLLTQLVVAVHQIYQGESQYPDGDDLIPALDVRGAIPGSARTEEGDDVGIENPFGGAVTVTGAGDRYKIAFTDLQQANCATLLDPYVGQARGSGGLWQVDIGAEEGDGTLAEDDVTADCADEITVTFHFE